MNRQTIRELRPSLVHCVGLWYRVDQWIGTAKVRGAGLLEGFDSASDNRLMNIVA
jgi:hypothetical protein